MGKWYQAKSKLINVSNEILRSVTNKMIYDERLVFFFKLVKIKIIRLAATKNKKRVLLMCTYTIIQAQ